VNPLDLQEVEIMLRRDVDVALARLRKACAAIHAIHGDGKYIDDAAARRLSEIESERDQAIIALRTALERFQSFVVNRSSGRPMRRR
jgi:hypothetical protein